MDLLIDMDSKARTVVSSGIEPIDRLLGGLESGSLYLVHGETSDSSLFGLKFVLEGVKHGENAALIVRYAPETAVQRFARLGYDCLEDVRTGRLVILEFADEIVHQVTRLRELSPTLRALGGLLDETRPTRVVFDTITDLVSSEHGNIDSRIQEFAAWAGLLGSTSLLIANGNNNAVIESFWPLIKESFRFERKEEGPRTIRLLAFEKSEGVPPQPIEVDPERGIFLSPSAQERAGADERQLAPPAESQAPAESEPPALERHEPAVEPAARATSDRTENHVAEAAPLPEGGDEGGSEAPDPGPVAAALVSQADSARGDEASELSDWLDELIAWAIQTPAEEPRPERKKQSPTVSGRRDWPGQRPGGSHIVEELLRPPEFGSAAIIQDRYTAPIEAPARAPSVHPRDFKVLIIDSDPSSSELLVRAVNEYTIEAVADEVDGMSRLMAVRPDLVILDLDLPTADGFRVLTHIRSSLNAPIIVVSGLYVRASDRIRSTELGADYYLTKPFSVKELRQKARQLIARHRGISEWITTGYIDRRDAPGRRGGSFSSAPTSGLQRDAAEPGRRHESNAHSARGRGGRAAGEQFASYSDFVTRVEENVNAGMEGGSTFSIVGCRVPQTANDGTVAAVQLYGILLSIIRAGDLISMNQRNDLVVLLQDADASGAKAFVSRLLTRVSAEMNQEPLIWLRSFPHLEEATEVSRPATTTPTLHSGISEGRGDRFDHPDDFPSQASPPSSPVRSKPVDKSALRESYIDLLKNL